jgi:exopolyphosphatase/guanosine-5'-triphosphate,3'-diphosphate pyrophosphatase
MRIAAIDIGTNSIHVVIAEATGHGGFDVLEREREVVQVGRGSFLSGRLRADAIARTAESLARFVALARSRGVERIDCTATAAVREAKNGGEFVRAARAAAGLTPRVIPAHEEGRLIWLAVRNALELPDEPVLVLDIGGGSMQMVVGTREKLLRVDSVPLGALRLTETFPLGDPPDPDALAALRRHVRRTAKVALANIKELKPTRLYGSSGSIHALAHVANHFDGKEPIEHLNGHRLGARALDRALELLESMSLAEREALPGIDAARAEILLPGAVALQHVVRAIKGDAVVLSDFGVREGLLADWIARHAYEIKTFDPVEDLKLRSVLRLLAKFRADEVHARHVTDLALALFDGFAREHLLGDDERNLLQYAGLLHDVGSAIGHDGHTEHSYYIIKNGGLRGLSAAEVEMVATVARYHGKAKPRKRDPGFAALKKSQRRAVEWLAALLRIAEALDRSQYQLVRSVRVTRAGGSLAIRAGARKDARLEVWAARQRVGLLERLAGRKVRVTLGASDDSPRPARPGAAATPAAPSGARSRAGRPAAATTKAARPGPAPRPAAPAGRSTRSAKPGRAPRPAPAAPAAAPRSAAKAGGHPPAKRRPAPRAPAGRPRRSGPS